MPDVTERDYGPSASTHRANLNDRDRELFDWFSVKLMSSDRDAKRFGTMIQAVACVYPSIPYWDAVAIVHEIASRPGFDETMKAAFAEAQVNLKKPTEA